MATILLPQKPKYYGREKEKLKARLEDVENKIDILKPKVETALNVFCASLPENDEDSELAEQFMMLEYQLQDLCDERYYLQKEINRQERSKKHEM